MTIRTFCCKTQRDYIRHIEAFASFLGRSPDTATGDNIHRFQFAQVEQGAAQAQLQAELAAAASAIKVEGFERPKRTPVARSPSRPPAETYWWPSLDS
jgi:integrase/recombinase XerD